MDFRSSKTFQNIKSAFSGECQAHVAYSFYAAQAEKDGLEPLYLLLTETAANEKEHAEVLFKKINNGGNNKLPETMDGLNRAILGEKLEATEKYRKYAEIARNEGFEEIAELFEKLRYIEETHMKRFEAIREKLLQNSMYRSDKESVWICMKCGNVEYGKNPPEKCPVCEHEGTYYKKASEEDMRIIK